MDYFPYYRTAKLNWQNGIRYNLSILKNKYFVFAEDKYQKSKKSHHWMINPMKAQETNEKLVKAWKKNVDQIKTSTIMPDALEDFVNEKNEVRFYYFIITQNPRQNIWSMASHFNVPSTLMYQEKLIISNFRQHNLLVESCPQCV